MQSGPYNVSKEKDFELANKELRKVIKPAALVDNDDQEVAIAMKRNLDLMKGRLILNRTRAEGRINR